MVDNRISKVFVSSVAALLLLSSVVFLAGTQADASDDLQILDIFEPDGTPPPRENIEYDYIVKWRNVGDDAYTAKVVLYEPAPNGDCSSSTVADETDEFTMSPGENGEVTLRLHLARKMKFVSLQPSTRVEVIMAFTNFMFLWSLKPEKQICMFL